MRVFNFSAGPSMMPLPVLQRAQQQLCEWGDSGCSVMEMSHRAEPYLTIFRKTEGLLRRLMRIPDDYAVLFLQGGATLQFSMLPMNLCRRGQPAAYAVTGVFAEKALKEAARWCDAYSVTDSEGRGLVPEIPAEAFRPGTAYLHITGNNTAMGTMYRQAPAHGSVPLAADWSSGILGSEIPVCDYDLIYAGAQKNMGPAGVTAVIVRRSLLPEETDPLVPSMLQYRVMDRQGSMLNTPPTYGIYCCGLMLEWVLSLGGIPAMEQASRRKSALLYGEIDSSGGFYTGFAAPECRSLTNVTFTLPDEERTVRFLQEAEEAGMIGLKGYRTVGGIRASLYNGMPVEGAEKLAEFMRAFRARS